MEKFTEVISNTLAALFRYIKDTVDELAITQTTFAEKQLTAGMAQGIKIGDGKCRAVRLKLNAFVTGTQEQPLGTSKSARILYGDARRQTAELTAWNDVNGTFFNSQWTPKIYCKDLSEVYLLQPNFDSSDNLTVQVMIYH